MQLTVLGCGNSTGVPIPTCRCKVCRSRHPRNQRTRCSAWLRVGNTSLLIDTATDLRAQALRERIQRVDAVLYTHAHTDHTQGIDELRCYCFTQKAAIPIYGTAATLGELTRRYDYIFSGKTAEGGAPPRLLPHPIDASSADSAAGIDIAGVQVIPLSVRHGSQEVLGYRIKSLAYITDCHEIHENTMKRLQGTRTLVLDCLRTTPHPTHLHLEASLEIAARVGARRTYLTHLGHDIDYTRWSRRKALPPGVALAYDGLQIKLPA